MKVVAQMLYGGDQFLVQLMECELSAWQQLYQVLDDEGASVTEFLDELCHAMKNLSADKPGGTFGITVTTISKVEVRGGDKAV